MNLWSVTRVAVIAFHILGISGIAHAQTDAPGIALKEVPVESKSFSLGEPIPAWVDPVTMPEAVSTEPIVIRVSDTQFLVGTTPLVYVHRALTINNAASLGAAGQLPIPFAPEYQRLQLHAVSIIRGGEKQDRTKSATIRFLQRETGLEQGIYRGLLTALIVVNDLRVGDTIEYAYSLHGHNPVFAGKFIDGASWDLAFPTEYRRVILNHPTERKISWRFIGDRQSKTPAPAESTSDGVRKLVFEERGAAGIPPEPSTPADYTTLRWLQFSEFNDWQEVAAWANDLFKVNGDLNDELRGVVAKLRQRPSDEERVVAALELVQSEIRYFSVALGESSHRPAQPDVILSRRYGDCKDKSILLLTLLKELGIPGKAVLLQSGRRKGLEKILPSPQAFDHVIVQATVDGKDFYLDATRMGQYGRLSRMGQAHEGTQILLVNPDTRTLSIVPVSAFETYTSALSEKATLAKLDGDAELEVRQTWTGLLAERNRVLFQQVSRDQVTRALGDSVERLYPGAKVVRDLEINDDRPNNVMTTVAVYRVPKFAIERQGYWLLRYSPSNMGGALPTPNSSTRKDPLQLSSFNSKTKYSFEAKLPDNASVIRDPRAKPAKTVKNKHFTYAVTSSSRGSRAKTELELSILADRIEARDVPAYAQDLREANNATNGVIIAQRRAQVAR